ncbi:MAG: recombinase family protein, partial [Candidatus Marinimicrobia bacterium]|nr:recombinase family protein [Candidatus Neomarinimicrobiota bacterium]
MKVGYARVSTLDQNLDLQTDALKKEGCEEIFEDHASGAKADRDGLRKALEFMREGDTLVVWKLDRLGRSLKHLTGNILPLLLIFYLEICLFEFYI